MTKFINGDVITDGSRTGVISAGFYWKDSDDGSASDPTTVKDFYTEFYPVVWDNGTQGYHHKSKLEYA